MAACLQTLTAASTCTFLKTSQQVRTASSSRPSQQLVLKKRCQLSLSLSAGEPFNRVVSFPCASSSPRQLCVRAAASGADAPSAAKIAKEIVPDTEISITKTSFGTIGLAVGLFLLSFGFGAYFNWLPGTDFSALMLTYGFPLTLIGFALKYAELKPVPCISYADAVDLRASQATPILVQVRSDVTRFRYGDEQHLEEALKRIFKYGQGGGIQRRFAPQLESITEEVYEGRYTLVLIFEAKGLTLPDFVDREAKFTSFFGPGVKAISSEVGEKKFSVRLVSVDSSVAV